MKKLIALALALVMILSLAACSDSTEETLKKGSITDKEDSSDKNNGSNEGNSGSNTVKPQDATIEECILVDEQGIKITAKSLDHDDILGPAIKVAIENNSGKSLAFSAENVSVNGYMNAAFLYVTVADGKKANEKIILSETDLELCNIETIADIELAFRIIDSENYDVVLDTEIMKLETSAAESYEYTFDDSGEVVYDENGIKIAIKGLEEDEIWGPSVVVYIENTSDQNVTVSTQDVSVNDYMITASLYAGVVSGKHYVGKITFLSSEMEDNDIAEIETIQLSFQAYNSDSYNTVFETDPIDIQF